MGPDEPRAEQDIFNDLTGLCTKPGFVHALAWISLRDNYVMFVQEIDSQALADSYASGRTTCTEFSTLIGLLIKSRMNNETKRMEFRMRQTVESMVKIINRAAG